MEDGAKAPQAKVEARAKKGRAQTKDQNVIIEEYFGPQKWDGQDWDGQDSDGQDWNDQGWDGQDCDDQGWDTQGRVSGQANGGQWSGDRGNGDITLGPGKSVPNAQGDDSGTAPPQAIRWPSEPRYAKPPDIDIIKAARFVDDLNVNGHQYFDTNITQIVAPETEGEKFQQWRKRVAVGDTDTARAEKERQNRLKNGPERGNGNENGAKNGPERGNENGPKNVPEIGNENGPEDGNDNWDEGLGDDFGLDENQPSQYLAPESTNSLWHTAFNKDFPQKMGPGESPAAPAPATLGQNRDRFQPGESLSLAKDYGGTGWDSQKPAADSAQVASLVMGHSQGDYSDDWPEDGSGDYPDDDSDDGSGDYTDDDSDDCPDDESGEGSDDCPGDESVDGSGDWPGDGSGDWPGDDSGDWPGYDSSRDLDGCPDNDLGNRSDDESANDSGDDSDGRPEEEFEDTQKAALSRALAETSSSAEDGDEGPHGAELVIESRDWYLGQNLRLFRVLFFLCPILLISLGIDAWQTVFRPEPKYFAVTGDLRVMEMPPLSEPAIENRSLGNWAGDVVVRAMSINFLTWRQSLSDLRTEFTDEGYESFLESLKSGGHLEKIIKERLSLSCLVSGAPVITASGNREGVMTWKLEMPLVVSYESSDGVVATQKLLAEVVVQRTLPNLNPKGVVIKQIILSKAG
jgi:intracellular multiplication protein IcmL